MLGPSADLLVGYSGRLAAEKQVADLAHLAGMAGVRTVVVGDGPARDRLMKQLPTASFLGYRSGEELARIVASLDVFVHTGPHETFCQAIQEAMASGVPVVAPASGGPLDLISHGRNGWLYPAGEPTLLRQAVGALHDDPRLRSVMGEDGRSSVAGRSWAVVGEELAAHYQRVVDRAQPYRRAA